MSTRSSHAANADTVFDRRRAGARSSAPSEQQVAPRKRRATSDGREPLVVYMLPDAIKALKIAAVEQDTTASAIVTEAVTLWLKNFARRAAR
jgi:hypothetical protein